MAGTALTVYDKITNPIDFCKQMATACEAVTGCSKGQGEAVALTCLCEGITPHEYARTYHNIQGKASMRADAMLASFRMNWGGNHRVIERTAERAAIVLKRKDGEEMEFELTWQQAQESRNPWKDWENHSKGLKDNWSTPTDRKAMLWARLVSDSIRAFQPEVVAGIYTPEEMIDAAVVSSEITTSPPARKSVEELASQAAAAAAATEEVEDATFTETSYAGDGGDGGVVMEVSPADAAAEVAAQTDPSQPEQGGYSTQRQRDRIEQVARTLVDAGQIPADAIAKAIQKRGVNSLRSLLHKDAQDILDRLEAKARKLAGDAGN